MVFQDKVEILIGGVSYPGKFKILKRDPKSNERYQIEGIVTITGPLVSQVAQTHFEQSEIRINGRPGSIKIQRFSESMHPNRHERRDITIIGWAEVAPDKKPIAFRPFNDAMHTQVVNQNKQSTDEM